MRDELGHALLGVSQLLRLDGDVGGLAAQPGEGLVHHDAGVRQRVALAGCTGGEQELPHGGGKAHAHRGNVARDELHGVVDGHAGGDRAAGAVDVQPDVGVRVLPLEVEQLGAQLVGDVVVHVGAQHDHPVLQQPREDVGARVGTRVESRRQRRNVWIRHGVKAISHQGIPSDGGR